LLSTEGTTDRHNHTNSTTMASLTARDLTPQQTARCEVEFVRITELLTRRKCDESYVNEYKRFVRWVEHTELREEEVFMHRASVDRYFEEDVIYRACSPGSIARIIQALEWFSKNLGGNLGGGAVFVVRSPLVEAARLQQRENFLNMPSSKLGTDPHKGLKDILKESDRERMSHWILDHRLDWGSLGTSFAWGNNAGVRGASSRKFTFADIYTSEGFGPEREGERARILFLVLRMGEIHKDRFTTDRMVGSWRHRNVFLCGVFYLSMQVIHELSRDDEINFCHGDLNTRASWWDKGLIQFNTLDEESGAMKAVYEGTGIEGCKLTHNRTYAVQQGGSEGLAPYQTNTFTKHMSDKSNKAYQPEVNKEACKVMAGFGKDEAYFVEREHLTLPDDILTLTSLLLPRYSTWVEQHHSAEGDKSTCCRRFLFEIIPHMVRVLVQDGIYLINRHPHHVMSTYLKVCTAWSVFLPLSP
jgi:hypothetical protein